MEPLAFKDDEELVEWVKRHAGRKVKWFVSEGDKGEGRIVGYQRASYTSGRIIVDNYMHALHGDPKNVLVVDVKENLVADRHHGGFAWLIPQWIRDFSEPEKTTATKKTISEFPHECPKCHGPAYIGFNVRVECQAKCL